MELNRINKMTFKQLRNELAKCDDPVKATLIRNLMYLRYSQHINKKKEIENIKKKKMEKYIKREKRIINNMENQNTNKNIDIKDIDIKDIDIKDINIKDIDIKELLDDDLSIDPDQFEMKQNFYSLNELDELDPLVDKRDITEYERDMVNNNIAERLNSDIDIRTMRENKQKKEFVMPYSDNAGGNYAPFDSQHESRITTFSNRRPKKKY